MNRKEKQVQRYLKAQKHAHTLAERKELERRSRERKTGQKKRSRTRTGAWEEDDDGVQFESIRRAPRASRAELARAIDARLRDREEEPAESPVASPEAAQTGAIGLVVFVTQGRVRVQMEGAPGQDLLEVVLAEGLARTQKSSVAVGDRVLLEERGDGSLRAISVLPRRTVLARPDPQNPHLERVVAANVDLAVIVVAVRNPDLRQRLIDRYLIAVQRGGVEPIVCANKADLLLDPGDRREVERVLDVYREIGVRVLLTSSATGVGVAELGQHIAERTVVFVGQSGVGKSTLLNAIAPGLELPTGRVRLGDGKGRHTTTASTMLDIGAETRLVDTPGVRSFGLIDVTRANLGGYFPEFADFAAGCRFRDCTHAHEPQCAVRRAAEVNALSIQRFETYQRILESLGE